MKNKTEKDFEIEKYRKDKTLLIEEIYQNELMSLEEKGLHNSKFYWTFS